MLCYDKQAYYSNYYNLRKHIYKERYLEKKRREEELNELYKKYGGEVEYMKQYWKNKMWNK